MKKFLLTILTGALVATSFTSCIENEIPDEVNAIYNGQADLLASRAALIAAEANYENARAEYENARAASENARAAGLVIQNEYNEARNAILLADAEARLEALVAQQALAVEKAKNDLALAMVQFEIDMKKLEQIIVDTDNALILKYFNLYRGSNNTLNGLLTSELTQQQAILVQEVANALAVTNDENSLAALANDIAEDEEMKAIILAEIAELEAMIADGTDLAAIQARRAALEATIADLDNSISAQSIALVEKQQELDRAIMAFRALRDIDGLEALEFKYNGLKRELERQEGIVAGLEAENEANTADIEKWQAILDDYDASLAQLEQDVADGKVTVETTETALVDARVVYNDALEVQTEENEALAQLIRDEARVANVLRRAATALQLLLDNATTAQEVIDATAAQGVAQTAYDTAKANFDDQTLPFTVTPGTDGFTGIISDNDEPNTTRTYLVITTITEGPVGTFSATYAAGVATTPATGTQRSLPLTAAAAIGDYIEVEADNTQTNDLQQFRQKTRALDNANDRLTLAIEADATYDADLLAAQELYDEKAALFADAVALLEAQQTKSDDADTAVDTAFEARRDARIARDEALVALEEAEEELRLFNLTTADQLADWIEAAQVSIDQNLIIIALFTNDIAVLQAEIDAVLAELETAETAELIAARDLILSLQAELDDLETEDNVLRFARRQAKRLLNAINNTLGGDYDFVMQEIETAQGKIADLEDSIAETQSKIDNFVSTDVAGVAALARLELQLSQTQADIVIYTELVAKYKALLDSVL